MLTLEDFMERLARGPLKNMAAVEQTNLGEILPEYYDTIRVLINEGLREISTKKMVTSGRVKVTWVENQTDYILRESNLGVFLEDYAETEEQAFVDDLFVRIYEIYTLDENGEDLARILPDSGQGISTPSFNRIRTTNSFRTMYEHGVRIQYQARHLALVELTDEITLPPSLEYPLQLFVASQYIAHMGGPEHSKKGDEYRAKYLQEMGEDEAKNLSTTSEVDFDCRFNDRGFV